MVRNRMMTAFAVAAVLAVGLLASRADAITQYKNLATASYSNEANQPQDFVSGTAYFDGQSNPVLEIVKTGDKAAGPAGTIVTWTIRVAYPRIADVPLVCGDDSQARNVVVTDPIPAAFLYNANTVQVSTNDGATWTPVADGASGLGFTVGFAGSTLTVSTPDLVEGQGDTVNCGASPAALRFRFQATKL